MSSPQFTPGPWGTNVSRLSDGSILVAHIVAEDGAAVAQLANHAEDRTLANGFVIAAAPELYVALEAARAHIGTGQTVAERMLIARINTALGLARGDA